MPVKDAMLTNVITGKPGDTVAQTLEIFDQYHIRSVPVVDEDNTLLGLFSLHTLLVALLPVSVDAGDFTKHFKHLEVSLDYLVGQSPWVAKRLKSLLHKPVGEVMNPNPAIVYPDTPLRETIRLVVIHGSPLPVIERDTGKLVGLMSSQATIKSLLDLKTGIESGVESAE